MNKIETTLKTEIQKIIENLYGLTLELNEIIVEIPKEKTLGDYSSTIAMRLAKRVGKNPKMIAEEIINNLDSTIIDNATVAGPGFINFVMKKGSLAAIINEAIMQGQNFGNNNAGNNQIINVEYISANPTGDLHLGHARGAAWGDSLTRILKKCGYDVIREFYMNDAGNQVHNLGLSLASRYASLFNVDFPLPEDGYHGEDVIAIAHIIKDKYQDRFLSSLHDEKTIEELSRLGVFYEMEKMREDLKLFRVQFDIFGSELKLRTLGKVDDLYDRLIESSNTYQQDGATFFQSTTYGDDKDRVIKKNDGSYTYLMPDMAYHIAKITGDESRVTTGSDLSFANKKPGILIDLLGGDHHGYIARIKASLQAFGYDKDSLEVNIIQMVRLIDGDGQEIKMSKRSGNAIKLRDFCSEVGVDAVRYFYVSRSLETPFDFDVSLATKQSNENPVYYIQYAHARICSILKNNTVELLDDYSLLVHEKEIALLQSMNEFSSVLANIAKERAVHKLCNYVYKLAQQFHSFYAVCKVVDTNNPTLTKQRLALLKALQVTLANALDLIGVEAKETM